MSTETIRPFDPADYLDDIEVSKVRDFERDFLDYLHTNTKVPDTIKETGLLEDDTEAELKSAVEAFRKTFISGGAALSSDVRLKEEDIVEPEYAEETVTRGKQG